MRRTVNFKSQLSLIASAIALSGLSAMTFTASVMAEESTIDENIEK
jgi:iron complex outermembrane receptor protein